jgi:threonine/homoserine/homoserine lactone efflux protein
MLSTLLTVWLLYLGAMVSPGPNILLVSQLAASAGRRSAWLAGLGVAFGAGVWASGAVLGVHALFLAFPRLRIALQLVGALYLLYIATRLWRSSAASARTQVSARGPWAAFRMGALTNLTNPKAALFFGSVFATSFPAQPGALLQLGSIAIVVCSAIGWYTLLAFVFSRNAVVQRYARVSSLIGRFASACFGVIGMSLLYGTVREAKAQLGAGDA